MMAEKLNFASPQCSGRKISLTLAIAAAFLWLIPAARAQLLETNTIIPTNSVWKFLRGTNEASNPITLWRTVNFNDASWESLPAPFHYGTNSAGGDDNLITGTILSDMSGNYSCIFLRKTFVVTNATQITSLRIRAFIDDGFIVWINGVETRRAFLPSGSLSYTNTAANTREPFVTIIDMTGAPTNLVVGTNVIAIQAFNFQLADDDFRIDPELTGTFAEGIPPVVRSINPASGSGVTNFAQLNVVFSESVSNVDAGDLRINGAAATGLTGSGSNYTFTFSPPAGGAVQVTWTPAHGIKDFANNPFDASNIVWTFSNTLELLRVIGANPAPGSSVSTLSQVTITWNASITSIDPGDLLINASPATGISGSGASRTFTFLQPPPGLVQLAWDSSHAIRDLAGNRFDEGAPGASWSYTLLDVIAPTVLKQSPAANATVTSFAQLEVIFSESVNGVNAGDLLINGQPATSVIGAGAGPYLFSFVPVTGNGTINASWAANHGITDVAGNAFAGGSWTYSLTPGLLTDVVINEVMADNLNGIVDSDGDTSDWIELYNRGNAPVNLLGWSLTDDSTNPGQWVFPAITLGAGQYLLVFASGKDRATTTGTNHTSFVLGNSEYLGLYNADSPRRVIDEFAPMYPEQRGDISWGRLGSNLVYFAVATPRAPNSTGTNYTGIASQPHASVPSGLFLQPFTLTLSCDTPGATIYYTTNCDVPNLTNATLYTGPFAIAGSSNKAVIPIRAVAFKAGLLPSTTLTRTYIFHEQVVYQPILPAGFPVTWFSDYPGATIDTTGDYEMDPQVLTNNNNYATARQALTELPVVSLVTSIDTAFAPNIGVYSGRKKQGNQRQINAEMWLPDGRRVFQADCGWEIQGGSSPTDSSPDWKDKKLSQRLIFKGDFGTPKLHAKVFEDTPVEDFDTLILDAGLNWWWTHMTDGTQRDRAKFVTDTVTSDLMNNAGMVAQHARYVHLYIDGLYWGLYFIHERMDESAAASYLGGQKEEWDVVKHDINGLQNGTLTNYTAMINVARTFTNAPVGANAKYEQLQAFLDVPWFIDYMIVNFWVGNQDWPHHNWYAWRRSRTPGSLPWRFVSWDAEHTFRDSVSMNWLTGNGNLDSASNPGELFRHLTNNLEFRVAFGDHVHKLMFNGGPLYTLPNTIAFWTPTNQFVNLPATAYRKRVDEIWNSIVCESARWGDVATANANNPYTRELHYTRELNALFTITNVGGVVNYFPLRGSNALAHFRNAGLYPTVAAPAFSQFGGRVAAGYSLIITNVAGTGTAFYTTNGADPRVYGSGSVAPQAVAYIGPVSLGRSATVKSRTLSGSTWSALNEAAFTVGELGLPLRITEIMYDPIGGDAYEFIELQNTGFTPLNLGGYYFEGITFTFQLGYTIAPGQRIVLASGANTNAFLARYPGVAIGGTFEGRLANEGERIVLHAAPPSDAIVLSVDYGASGAWPSLANGGGYSLELVSLNGDADDAANWKASAGQNGSPGQANSAAPSPSVLINEVAAENLTAVTNGGTFPDWVELFNPGASAVNIGGWSLSDSGAPRKFVFRAGTTIGAGGYLVVWCDTNSAAPGIHTGFGLKKSGDSVFLYDANTNRIDGVSFGQQVSDFTIGRVGGVWQLTTPTTNAANVAATTAPANAVVINEWLANSAPGAPDWFELFNTSSTAVAALKNFYVGNSNTVFQMRPLTFLAPRGYLQLFADENGGVDHVDFKLSAGGDAIVLYDATGGELNRVTFGAQAQGVSAGRLPDGSATIATFAASASPGASNFVVNYTGPVLHEVLARNQSAIISPFGKFSDFIELRNTNASAANIGGMGLGDSAGNADFIFPTGTTVPANGYLVVWCDDARAASTSSGGPLNSGFNLSGTSGGVYLFNAAGQVVNLVEFGFQVPDLSIGVSGGQWRLLASPTPGAANSANAALGATSNLRVNEWMADPSSGDDWFELYNADAAPVDLSGLYLSDDPSLGGRTNTLVAPLSFIAGKGFVKWIADGNPGAGRDHANFSLDAAGETIQLYTPAFTVIDSVSFGLQTTGVSQGRLPDGGANIVSFPTTPTPDESNYLPLQSVVINEVLTHTDLPLEDAIELQNGSGGSVNIGGWFISNSQRELKKFQVPTGTTLAANGFKVFYEGDFNPGGTGVSPSFTLNSARGDAVYLSEADAGGNLTGYRAQVIFGAAENGVSFGRFVNSQTNVDFVAMAQRTFGADNPASVAQFRTGAGLANSAPKIGPIVLNEINYQPVVGGGTNLVETSDEEFIELANITGAAVPLFDPARPTNSWKLGGGVSFVFSNVTIPANGYLIVANFDPANAAALASFRARYGNSGTVVGPFGGRLDNTGEAIELTKPDAPQLPPHPDAGLVPDVLVDRVVYSNVAPWPTNAAAGGGASLQRITSSNYGNEPLNWKAAFATAGRANTASGDQPPIISAQPQTRTVVAGTTAAFTVTASGTAPLGYQWQRNGVNIPSANSATLTINNAQAADSGTYRVIVSNGAGSITSQNASLVVLVPPTISVQPQNQSVVAGTTAQFSVSASGTLPLRYQWQFNGADLPNQENAQLTLNNVQPSQLGNYRVVITNLAGSVTSSVATLAIAVPPTITSEPVDRTTVVGGSVTFTVSATGTAPLSYQWRKNSIDIFGATSASYTIAAAQPSDEAFYSVLVSNPGGTALSAAARLTLSSSAFLTGSQLLGNGAFQFTVVGQSNRTYAVEFSTNLSTWTNLTSVTLTNTTSTVTDASATNSKTRFYRLRANP